MFQYCFHLQATQASSSHLAIDLAAILRVPSRTLSNSESDFTCFFAGDSEMALGTCPACAGRHRPHTYAEGCHKAAAPYSCRDCHQRYSSSAEGTSLDRVLADPLHADDEVRPNASSSSDPRPPGQEPQPGAGPDTMLRERPAIEIQPVEVSIPQKDTTAAMQRLVNCLRNSSELLKCTSQT